MSTATRDLWPADLVAEDVLGPEDILDEQAELLTRRMHGLLQGRIVRTEASDRIMLGFEVYAPRLDQTKRLFSVHHRLELEYPAAFVSPSEEIPRYLRAEVTIPGTPEQRVPGLLRSISAAVVLQGLDEEKVIPATEPRVEVNEWVAGTPTEFTDKLAKVLASPTVKSVIVSLLAKSQRTERPAGSPEPSP